MVRYHRDDKVDQFAIDREIERKHRERMGVLSEKILSLLKEQSPQDWDGLVMAIWKMEGSDPRQYHQLSLDVKQTLHWLDDTCQVDIFTKLGEVSLVTDGG